MIQAKVQHRTLILSSPYIAKTLREGPHDSEDLRDFRHDAVYGLFHCEKNDCVLSFPGPTSAHALSDGMPTVGLPECGLVCTAPASKEEPSSGTQHPVLLRPRVLFP